MWWRLAWIAAFALALGGGVWYAVADSDVAWWIGGFLAAPLCGLVALRGRRVGDQGDTSGIWHDGPWGAP